VETQPFGRKTKSPPQQKAVSNKIRPTTPISTLTYVLTQKVQQ